MKANQPVLLAALVSLILLLGFPAQAQTKPRTASAPQPHGAAARAPATAAYSHGEERALDVKGQSRLWNKLSQIQRSKESVDFVKTRTDYRAEIENSKF